VKVGKLRHDIGITNGVPKNLSSGSVWTYGYVAIHRYCSR
jgi:hypothetical protein